jgi:hypothetical protein
MQSAAASGRTRETSATSSQLFPEFAGDEQWERIAKDERPRPALTELLNRYETDLGEDPETFPRVAEDDFDARAIYLTS